jgi:alcohol dehydrogenase
MRSQSLMLVAPHQMSWIEQDLPPVGPRDLLVETSLGAISIGAELPQFRGDARSIVPERYPRMTGYESLGIVRERGAAVRRFKVGDRVVASYGHRTHAVVPIKHAIRVPPDIGDELAVLVILSGDVAAGIRKLGPALKGSVLVTGAGAIGLLAVFVLTALGAPVVDVVEPRAVQREMAISLGARRAVTPELAATLGEGYAGGVECSSRDAAFALLQERLRRDGRLCVLADGNIEPLSLAPAFHLRELTVFGSSDCRDYQAHTRWYFSRVRQAESDLARLFDVQIESADLSHTFARLATDATTATKVLVRYDVSSVG